MGGFRRAYEVLQEGFVLPLPSEERLPGPDEVRLPLGPMGGRPVALPQFPELPRPKPVELVRRPTPACFRHEALGPGERGERLNQGVAIRIPRRIDAMGLGKAL